MEHSIFAQTEPIRVGAIGTVRMDKETHLFVTELNEAARKCQILPGRPFLGLYNIPGVALVIQGVPVFTPWLNGPAQAEALLNAAPLQTLRSAVVGLQLLPNGRVPQINKLLPGFPTDYRLCGTATYPYQQQEILLLVPGAN